MSESQNHPKIDPKIIINLLAVLLRNIQLYHMNNLTVQTSLHKLLSALKELFHDEESLTVELIGDYFYLNSERIRFSTEDLLNFDYLVREFKKKKIGEVTIRKEIKEEDIKIFVNAFHSDHSFETIEKNLLKSSSISIEKLKKIQEEKDHSEDKEADYSIRQTVKKTYFGAVSFMKGLMDKIKVEGEVSIKKAKRVMETMVDMILEEEDLMIGMTAIKDYDEYTYHHSINVSILSIALGQRLGLKKHMLTDLGIVALFHDFGKMHIPQEVLNKSGSFSDNDWIFIKKHPYWGASSILKLKGLDPISIKTALVAFEHHMYYDHTGYPEVITKSPLDFYSRIVSIADQYDAITSSRVYFPVGLPPDKALRLMLERTGTQLDPLLIKFFINLVGVFPVGTLVLLDTKEMGLVSECNRTFADRPKVCLLVNQEGQKIDGKQIVDLSERDSSGHYARTIIKTLDPYKYKINMADYLF